MLRLLASGLVLLTFGCDAVSGLDDFMVGDAGGGGQGVSAGGNAGGSGGAGSGGDGGATSGGGGDFDGDYAIPDFPQGMPPVIDGDCDETVWGTAMQIPFGAFKNSNATAIDCRLGWTQGTPPLLFGCCETDDGDIEAVVTTADNGPIFDDDAIELIIDANTDDVADGNTQKVMINALGTVHDGTWEGGPLDLSPDAQVQQAIRMSDDIDGEADDSYWRVEFAFELPFAVVADQVGKCQLAVDDSDGGSRTRWVAFGSTTMPEINVPSAWGTCSFAR